MSLKLMYITNNPEIALIAQEAGVDRIWVDLEKNGKEERQKGMNTVKSDHTLSDISVIKSILTSSELLVRINPIYPGSQYEINEVIRRGADVIMLPMFMTKNEVEVFIRYVNGRAKCQLLLETKEAVNAIEDILSVEGIDEIHVGLNDLHLAYSKKFMFEILIDGTLDRVIPSIRGSKIPFGIGGIARIGFGDVPAELIINEHYRLGSEAAILSRSFCNANTVSSPQSIKDEFCQGVSLIRNQEKIASAMTVQLLNDNYKELERLITLAANRVKL